MTQNTTTQIESKSVRVRDTIPELFILFNDVLIMTLYFVLTGILMKSLLYSQSIYARLLTLSVFFCLTFIIGLYQTSTVTDQYL